MRRRGFLGALLGFAAAPVLARLPQFVDDDRFEFLTQEPLILPPYLLTGRIVEIGLEGCGQEPRIGGARLLRSNQTLLAFHVNEEGGLLYWRAPPDAAIIATERWPVTVDVSRACRARIFYTPLDGGCPRVLHWRDGWFADLSMWGPA